MKDIFPQGSAWIDGKFVKLSEARIPILDWGLLRSDATYDVVHVWRDDNGHTLRNPNESLTSVQATCS